MNDAQIADRLNAARCRPPGSFSLHDLVAETGKILFNNPLTADEELRCRQLGTGALKGQKHNVYQYFGSWRTQLTLGGIARVIGYFRADKLYGAIRFTDMAIWYFWAYRVRTSLASPGDANLNINLKRATFDLENEPKIVDLLRRIKERLTAAGILPDAPSLEQRQRRTAARTTNADLLVHIGQLDIRVTELEALIAKLMTP